MVHQTANITELDNLSADEEVVNSPEIDEAVNQSELQETEIDEAVDQSELQETEQFVTLTM